MRARGWVPSDSVTPRTALALAVDRGDAGRRCAACRRRRGTTPARRRASRRFLRPAAPPAPRACIACDSAPRPDPGISGVMPHTIGPPTVAVPVSASCVKNVRSTSAAERWLQRSSTGAPVSFLRRPILVSAGSGGPFLRRLDGHADGGDRRLRVPPVAVHLTREHPADRVECRVEVVVMRPRGAVAPGDVVLRRVDVLVLEPVAAEIELVDDRHRPERDVVAVADVDGRAAEPLTGGRAADRAAGLHEQHREPGTGEVGGRDQPVVPGADDDRVVVVIGAAFERVRHSSILLVPPDHH